jgi:hypothetical protein
MEFIKHWLWQKNQKFLLLFLFILGIVYLCLFQIIHSTQMVCDTTSCTQFVRESIAEPFIHGDFIPSVAIAIILMFLATRHVLYVWLLISFFTLPLLVYEIVFKAPVYGTFYNKVGSSSLNGYAYLTLSVIIFCLVPVCEWLYRRFRRT